LKKRKPLPPGKTPKNSPGKTELEIEKKVDLEELAEDRKTAVKEAWVR
jgi:hypothetical protein